MFGTTQIIAIIALVVLVAIYIVMKKKGKA
jgi:hypothetical protein